MSLKLSTLAISLGLGLALLNIYGLLNPTAFAAGARKFPRSLSWGYPLVMLATIWFLWNLKNESISDFESFKPALYALFVAVGVGTCLFVKDFLAARGLAVVMMLLAKLVVDTARWADSDWRLVLVVWAYFLVLAGMWFTISPWRLRDLLNWSVANEKRTRVLSGVRCAFGLFIALLGFTVF
ncbi:MAG: hypothetical protein M3Y82_13620 [Verrucomicrobiota bacterium]|nr:hypothetical protein [Verrucomicrobiota bacterium]